MALMHMSFDSTSPVFAPCTDGARLGLGGAALGNLFEAITPLQAQTLVAAAWQDGCRSFDTAPHYGHGLSERRLGDALRPHARGILRLSSKVGRLLTPSAHAPNDQHGYVQTLPFVQHWDYSVSGVRRSVEDSLQRLGLARLDTVFVHDMDAHTHGAQAEQILQQVLDHTLPALAQLKQEGLIAHVGLGVNDHEVVEQVLRHADLDALLLAGRYTLLDNVAGARLLPLLLHKKVALSLGGVFNSGILASRIDPRQSLRFNYQAAPAHWVDKALQIQKVCDAWQVPIQAAALQFALAHPATQLVWLGAKHEDEWHASRQAQQQRVPPQFWQDLQHQGLLAEGLPTP
jgi:D-threo-aldose 1-dehydrogenase